MAEAEADEIAAAPTTAPPVPLQAVVQEQLLEIWRGLLKTRDLTPESNFFECGGNSFLALRMMTEAEKLARQPLPLSLLLRGATVRELARHILEGAHQTSAEIIPVQPKGSRPPLFFLHGDWIGGGFYCNRLARDLGEDQPFFALPPYHSRGETIPTVREMAAHHVAALRGQAVHGPYYLGGYCIGATVAIEAARQLLVEGEQVPHLFLVDPPLLGGPWPRFAWPAVDRIGQARGWSLEKKIAFYDRSAATLGRWWRQPLAAKLAMVRRRLGLKVDQPEESADAHVDDLGAAAVLDGLEYSAYYLSYRLHRPAPLAVAATLFYPEDTPADKVSLGGQQSRIEPAHLHTATIRGSHTNCITEHTDSLAGKMLEATLR
jgi:thioesterase domain-containing protein